ncbi:hypothetical protein BGZ60DRAFT_423014 [Tricladium varicosporioides]|nr:hypothetical protein BGZ60DRAFT_423014 [Hymenoscyphus varicosporioides]
MIPPPRKAIMVGISGASSSGKTTLSRLLRDIFPCAFILHEDDFFKGDDSLPIKNGIKDGDCVEALKVPELVAVLEYIRYHGSLPEDFKSHEDQNLVGDCHIPVSIIASLKAKVTAWTTPGQPGHRILVAAPSRANICIVDGFLLYAPAISAIHRFLDVKLFLPINFSTAKKRRDDRGPYVTKDGLWHEPEGYFERIVWSNYVREHKWMFKDGDVEQEPDDEVLKGKDVKVISEGGDVDMEIILKWAVETLMNELERVFDE